MDSLNPLRQLVALGDTGNFRLAGEALGVSHSAVSQTIRKLEESYGVELFDRTRGRTVPTAFGERLIESARRSLNDMDTAARDLQLMESHQGGRLVIGVDPAVSESLLSLPLAKMINKHPSLQFTVLSCNRARWEKRLRNREIDMYLGLQPDREEDVLSYRKLVLQPPALFCRSDHALLSKPTILINDLRHLSVIGGDVPDWFLWRILDAYPDAFTGLQDLRGTFLTSQDFGLLRQLLLRTNALAILPEFIIHQEVATGLVRKVEVQGWPFNDSTISGVAAWLRERPLPPAAKQLLSEVQRMLDQSVFRRRTRGEP
ncbi:LysR family transcriptional regulator [Falsiruegeria mediterranea]|uniref:HTH-type transcriptional regulator CynR n=1 Tax=Falsiruegeria mediterranea M17 TaxID=1200281 RepID=A0A2R8CAA7_9RHOB|nr:LysR family transcriptional regulator [Falsiruegeria mediterranea]SPJ29308.1 HTH-type transcriptional regulator CynR [Falsiruegeria mediterranea M17]